MHNIAVDDKLEARFYTTIDEVKKNVAELKKEVGDIKKDAELKGFMLISIMQSRKE